MDQFDAALNAWERLDDSLVTDEALAFAAAVEGRASRGALKAEVRWNL